MIIVEIEHREVCVGEDLYPAATSPLRFGGALADGRMASGPL